MGNTIEYNIIRAGAILAIVKVYYAVKFNIIYNVRLMKRATCRGGEWGGLAWCSEANGRENAKEIEVSGRVRVDGEGEGDYSDVERSPAQRSIKLGVDFRVNRRVNHNSRSRSLKTATL